MIAGVNVSYCFSYQLTQVILNSRAVKQLVLFYAVMDGLVDVCMCMCVCVYCMDTTGTFLIFSLMQFCPLLSSSKLHNTIQ